MKLHSFVSCILAAGSLVVFPALSLAHGGGGGHGFGRGGGGHGFGRGGFSGHGFRGEGFSGRGFGRGGFGGHGFNTSFADVSGRGFGSGFRGARGFADRGVFGRGDHGRFGDRGFRGRDRDFRDRRFRDFDGDFFDFGFYGFGYPYYYPYDYYPYDYPYYYSYPFYSYGAYLGADDSGDYQSPKSGKVASLVQSALGQRGYYRGPIDGVIGAGSRRAIRNFQTDQGLPVNGSIDSKLIKALRIS
jgi:Putative peptidoglycan binding domain